VLYGSSGDPATAKKRYLVMRDEKTGRLKLNALLMPSMTFKKSGKKGVRFFATMEEAATSIVEERDEKSDALIRFKRVINHDKVAPMNVVLHLTVPSDRVDDVLEAVEKAKK